MMSHGGFPSRVDNKRKNTRVGKQTISDSNCCEKMYKFGPHAQFILSFLIFLIFSLFCTLLATVWCFVLWDVICVTVCVLVSS